MATNTLTFLCVFAALVFCAKLGESVRIRTNPREIVNKHNALRREVQPTASNMLEMRWNRRAAYNARKWANTCSMKHSVDDARKIRTSGCGENLYMSSFKNSWSNAVQAWYDEVKDWRYGVGSTNGGVVGHFTQVVWYRSYQVGCAVAYCPNSQYKYFYVCQYCPAGNMKGQLGYPYKSGPTCADCPRNCRNKLCTNPCPFIDKYSNCGALKKQVTCNHKVVAANCHASCKCGSKIK